LPGSNAGGPEWPNGTSAADAFTAPTGNSTFNGLGGVDTIIFDFKLTDATFTWIGNELIVETAASRTVLTGFEVFQFKDGTVHNNGGDPLVDDLYYYVNSPDVWSAHADADAHYRQFRLARGPQSQRPLRHQALSVDLSRRRRSGLSRPSIRPDQLDRESAVLARPSTPGSILCSIPTSRPRMSIRWRISSVTARPKGAPMRRR
jgi:hypothetical protein